MKKSFLIICLFFLNTAINASEGPQSEQIEQGIFSKAASGLWSMASVPVEAGIWCVKKTYDTAGKCATVLYKNANGMMYIVGVATTGIVIYVFLNGKFEKQILIRDISQEADAQAIFQFLYTMDFPLFGKVMWEMPEVTGKQFENLMQKNAELVAYSQKINAEFIAYNEKIRAVAEKTHGEIGHMLNIFSENLKGSQLPESARGILQYLVEKLTPSFEALQDLLSASK